MAARLLPYLDRAQVAPEIQTVSVRRRWSSTLTIAAANFTNRFNEALGTELEFEEARHG